MAGNPGPFQLLSDDLLASVLGKLNSSELRQVAPTCRRWAELLQTRLDLWTTVTLHLPHKKSRGRDRWVMVCCLSAQSASTAQARMRRGGICAGPVCPCQHRGRTCLAVSSVNITSIWPLQAQLLHHALRPERPSDQGLAGPTPGSSRRAASGLPLPRRSAPTGGAGA